jgi:hypothetical protein
LYSPASRDVRGGSTKENGLSLSVNKTTDSRTLWVKSEDGTEEREIKKRKVEKRGRERKREREGEEKREREIGNKNKG